MKTINLKIIIIAVLLMFNIKLSNSQIQICQTDNNYNINNVVSCATGTGFYWSYFDYTDNNYYYIENSNLSTSYDLEAFYNRNLINVNTRFINSNGVFKLRADGWCPSSGYDYFEMYTSNHLSFRANCCEGGSYSFEQLVFGLNNFNYLGEVIKIYANSSLIYQSSNGYANLSGIGPGNYNIEFNYNHPVISGCTIKKKGQITITPRPVSSKAFNLPDTVLNTSATINNIENYFNCNGTSYEVSGNGIIWNGTTYSFSPQNAGVGNSVIGYRCKNFNTGCSTDILDTIYVARDISQDAAPLVSMLKNTIDSTKWKIGFFSENTTKHILAYSNYQEQQNYEVNVCDSKTYTFGLPYNTWVLYPPNDPNRVEYSWFLNVNGVIDTLTLNDTTVTITIPDNKLNDLITLSIKQKKQGVYGNSSSVRLRTQGKPISQINTPYCYNDTLIFSLTPSDSTKEYIGYKYSDTIQKDSIVFGFRGQKVKDYILKTNTYTPYKNKKDSLNWVSNGMFSVTNYIYQTNTCNCDWYDTITMVQKPIPNFTYAGLDTVGVNYRIDISNNSLFFDSAIWNSTMDNQKWNQDNFSQYTSVWGNHSFFIQLYDNYGCRTDTSLIDLFYCDNPSDSVRLANIEDNEYITFFSLFPNPTSDYINVQLTSQKNEQTELYIMDLQGRIIQTTSLTIAAGNNRFQLGLDRITPGTYIILFKGEKINGYYKIKKI